MWVAVGRAADDEGMKPTQGKWPARGWKN